MGANLAEILRFVEETMDRLQGQPRTAVITVPAPFAPPTAFLRLHPRNMSFFWDSPGGTSFSGAGAVRTLRVSGKERYQQLREQLSSLWNELGVYAHPECNAPPPRVFGGLAFHPGSVSPPWEQFGDGCFTLPRWCYARRSSRAFLGLAVQGDVDCEGPRKRELLDELQRNLTVLANAEEQSAILYNPQREELSQVSLQQVELSRWVEHVEKIRAAIAAGEFQKVVAARRCDVSLPQSVDELEVLSRLVVQPMCTRFLFSRENLSFLGASPEVLFDKRGNVLRTEALAGTACCPAGAEPDAYAKELLESEKDRSEHAIVVDEIARALAPFCDELRASKQPKVHRIREILHLHTPFKGKLKRDVDAVSILEALHPTPAVGGLPTAKAADWIASHERDERGWYTGPVGWIDAIGDSRFVVAIRSGLVGEGQAYVFTGAGIVGASHAHAEYAETSLKQLPLLRALGIADQAPAQDDVPDLPAPGSHRSRALMEMLRVAGNA
ncbi:isochorismate synthase [Pendulispora brunnea]|uniref:isochorismate synthase n=1 Tax=Pendulispora brunnea TaxID=2905690 RepID=A0ABZ2JWR7_9BACT